MTRKDASSRNNNLKKKSQTMAAGALLLVFRRPHNALSQDAAFLRMDATRARDKSKRMMSLSRGSTTSGMCYISQQSADSRFQCTDVFGPTNIFKPPCLLTTTAKQRVSSSLFSSFSTYSDFQPSEATPPFSGTAMFKNVDLKKAIINDNEITEEAKRRNADPDAIFVVTGASRGIGCQYVKSLLDRTQGHIVACCRSPDFLENELNVFLKDDGINHKGRVTVAKLDVEDQETIDALADRIKRNFGSRVDGLFNVAGILGDGGKTTPGPERSVTKLERNWVETSFRVNTIGPMMMCHALAPFLKVSSTKSNTRSKSIIVNMSARVGSISDNGLGGWYSYRASKAALNQFSRTLALEVTRRNKTWVVALHPGTTRTALSAPFQKNVKDGKLFPVEFTVGRMLDIVDCMEEHHSGGFYDWDGKALPF